MNRKTLELIEAIAEAERDKDFELRSELAMKLFKNHRRIEYPGGEVETWYDPQSRNYITEQDVDDGQDYPEKIQDAQYTGHAMDAAIAHFWAIREALKQEAKNPSEDIDVTVKKAWKKYLTLSRDVIDQGEEFTGVCDTGICTESAYWIKCHYFPHGKIVGYAHEDNPDAVVGETEGGHDFLLVDGRYLIDFWYKDVYEPSAKMFYDLKVKSEEHEAHSLYGPKSKWKAVAVERKS